MDISRHPIIASRWRYIGREALPEAPWELYVNGEHSKHLVLLHQESQHTFVSVTVDKDEFARDFVSYG